MKKCSIGTKHKWEWLRNTDRVTAGHSTIRFSKQGIYKCACGCTKYGPYKASARIEN